MASGFAYVAFYVAVISVIFKVYSNRHPTLYTDIRTIAHAALQQVGVAPEIDAVRRKPRFSSNDGTVNVAVVGSGIAGLSAAYALHQSNAARDKGSVTLVQCIRS